jgi:hypothetical protein
VSVNVPVPGILDASMNRTSPPAWLLRPLLHLLVHERRSAKHVHHDCGSHRQRGEVSLRATTRRLAADGCDFAFEIPHPGFARVPADDCADRIVRKCDVFGLQPVVRDLLLDEMLARNRELLLFRIARDLEHFHAIAQCRRHRVEHISGRDEQHLGEVERNVEIVIAEG